MKREIKFRGLHKISGQLIWVYGFLTIDGKEHYISQPHTSYNVIPETVGQFIGLKGYVGEYKTRHKNEVELFEGDIVEAMSEGSKGTFEIKFRQEAAPMWLLSPNWQNGKHWNISASDLGRTPGDYYDDLKLIGNIHEKI